MRRRVLTSLALVVAAACSGESDENASTTQGPSATDSSTSVATTVAVADVDPPSSAVPATTDPEAEAETEPVDASVPSDDRPFVINGPASVDDGDRDRPADDAASDPLISVTDCATVPRGLTELVVDGGGAAHDVRVFVPETLLAEPAPVVLNWHGLGSNGTEQAVYSGYEDLAAAEGFIAVHATGTTAAGDDRNSWELSLSDGPERDDLAFADVLIDTIVAEWCGDSSRIYSTGMSNGGFFTAELVCNRSERIAAAVSVAGLSHAPGCAPTRAVPYLAFHGTDDSVVPFDGSGESVLVGADDVGSEFFTQVMPDEFAEFAADADCAPEPVRTEESADVVRYDYIDCVGDTPMRFYELPGSGHTWPGSPVAELLGDTFGYHTSDVSATEAGWAFFAQHAL